MAQDRTILDTLPQGARVAVVRLRSLGDCILTTPALSLLHRTRPDLRIAVVVEPRFREVFENHPAVREILPPSISELRLFGPDLTINYHGGTRSQWLTALSGARWRAGFAHHTWSTPVYNIRIPRAQRILGVARTVHTAEHLASLMFALGVPLGRIPGASLYGPPPEHQDRYAVLHPFASEPAKQWPAERFCELARYLKLWGIRPLFLGASDDDLSAFSAFDTHAGSLRHAINKIRGSALFIGNDSGPAHIAAALRVPALVVFGASNPAIWGPWETESEVVISGEDGIGNVPVSRVIAALDRLVRLEEVPPTRSATEQHPAQPKGVRPSRAGRSGEAHT